GREAQLDWRSGAVHRKSARDECGAAEGLDRRDQRSESRAVRPAEGSRDSDAGGAIRDGVQDAEQRAGPGGYEQGAEGGAGGIWRASGRRFVRIQLPAGAAAGRARGALHSALSPRLGPSQRGEGEYGAEGGRGRSADGGADQRPEAARDAG